MNVLSIVAQRALRPQDHGRKLNDTEASVEIRSYIDADVFNEDANYDEKFWNVLAQNVAETHMSLTAQTIPNNFWYTTIHN